MALVSVTFVASGTYKLLLQAKTSAQQKAEIKYLQDEGENDTGFHFSVMNEI